MKMRLENISESEWKQVCPFRKILEFVKNGKGLTKY